MSIKETQSEHIIEYQCDNATDFINCLTPTFKIWESYHNNTWIFRGQGDSEWTLQPSVFREGSRLSYRPGQNIKNVNIKHWIIEQEWMMLYDFFVLADKIGLPVPAEAYKYMLNSELRNETSNEKLYRMWPPINMHEAIALAQHHGVPTRMLDFTFNQFIAAYFAAYQAMRESDKSGNMCVWAINRFKLKNWVGRFKEVHARRFENKNLNEQEGVFLIDTEANDDIFETGSALPFDEVAIAKLNKFKEINPTSYKQAYPVFLKVLVPKTNAISIIHILNRFGYNGARLMPSYDKVVHTLEMFSDNDLAVL